MFPEMDREWIRSHHVPVATKRKNPQCFFQNRCFFKKGDGFQVFCSRNNDCKTMSGPDTIILLSRQKSGSTGDLIVNFKVTANAGTFLYSRMKKHYFQLQIRRIKLYLPDIFSVRQTDTVLKFRRTPACFRTYLFQPQARSNQ